MGQWQARVGPAAGRCMVGVSLAVGVILGATGCAGDEPPTPRDGLQTRPRVTRVPAPLPAAHCSVDVEGTGIVDLETEYLPRVVQCENGGADLEALKAQAVAARSVAYYSIETNGSICDSQGCQVFSCGRDPDPIHIQAVQETSGLYLHNNDTLTYGFYVAGDPDVMPTECIGDPGVGTERWVTYNEGRAGIEVEQTDLGFVFDPGDNGYGQNRGCMSQWGARCLEAGSGYDFRQILRFYYGDDIVLEQANGECVLPLPGGGTDGGGTAGDAGADGGDGPGGSDGGGDGPGGDDGGADGPRGDDDGAGTGGDDGGALPPGFGDGEGDGCGCRSESPPPVMWAVAGLWLGLRRRRRG